ncbi:PilZ domain-containing protein [Caldanaerobius polysaccharolyticus]|uniref:PilZ domain-containing protein n=1 Tax=Caldanaerobius polysaccharolyticus TaxID=44256 RepID=UPI00068D482D|nr:PilZ domain-containing protein [Caldanaerobius polysaccharolyticus]
MKNRRKYFRVKLHNPLCAKMTIKYVYGKAVKTGYANVCVNDIGPGGLKFLSNLKLQANPNIVLEFELNILNTTLKVYGTIVRIEEIEPDIFGYGVEFVFIEDTFRTKLISIFNELAIYLKKNIKSPNGNFCKLGEAGCFKTKKQKNSDSTYV